MSDESDKDKRPEADPDIPDEIKGRMNRSHRPAGFYPKSGEAEALNEPEEAESPKPVRNTKAFFKKLAVVLKTTSHTRTVVELNDVKRNGEWVREQRTISVPVKIVVGEDGLPYVVDPVPSEETRRIRAMNYEGAPKMLSSHGDLTPDFVEWLYLNHPYEAAVRYASRSTHIQVAASAKR